jgi:hypothetical protein
MPKHTWKTQHHRTTENCLIGHYAHTSQNTHVNAQNIHVTKSYVNLDACATVLLLLSPPAWCGLNQPTQRACD